MTLGDFTGRCREPAGMINQRAGLVDDRGPGFQGIADAQLISDGGRTPPPFMVFHAPD